MRRVESDFFGSTLFELNVEEHWIDTIMIKNLFSAITQFNPHSQMNQFHAPFDTFSIPTATIAGLVVMWECPCTCGPSYLWSWCPINSVVISMCGLIITATPAQQSAGIWGFGFGGAHSFSSLVPRLFVCGRGLGTRLILSLDNWIATVWHGGAFLHQIRRTKAGVGISFHASEHTSLWH